MRASRLVALVTIVAGIAAGTAFVAPSGVVARDPGPGYFATQNVEWLGYIPLNNGSAGARVLDDRLYVTEQSGLTIYDIEDPASPQVLSFTPSPQAAYFTQEDPDTNGEILVVGTAERVGGSGALATLNVLDVSDPTAPAVIGSVEDGDEHTNTCVLDCRYVYGSSGVIIDLTDPTSPTIAGDWRDDPDIAATGVDYAHDITEVRPGLLMFSSTPLLWIDASDPLDPQVLSTGEHPTFAHGNLWPNAGRDDFLLVGGESFGSCNTETAGEFSTYDARAVRAADHDQGLLPSDPADAPGNSGAHRRDGRGEQDNPGRGHGGSSGTADTAGRPDAEFTVIDTYRVGTGMYTDGDSPYNQYCAHWFTTEPGFRNGGLVAAAWYEHGTRFLDIGRDGSITEAGWFVPLGGSQSAAYWVSDDVVLTTDYQRGIDILRFHRDVPKGDTPVMVGQASAVAQGVVDPNTFFPWYGLSAAELARQRAAWLDANGNYTCALPFGRGVLRGG